MRLYAFLFLIISSFSTHAQESWKDIVVTQELEVYVDTLSIEYKDNYYYARIKTVYMTENSRNAYVDKIRRSYKKQDKKVEKKLQKWNNFGYNISRRVYDCRNKCYQTLEITDYTIDNKKIIKTQTPKKLLRWVNVGTDTMGDYTLFFVCDFLTE